MAVLATNPRTIFLGQAVEFKGTGMTAAFDGCPVEQLVELPVFEDTQLGMSIGLALDGWLPVSIYPRWNFLVCAANQLVNHLDKLPATAPAAGLRVIIRTASATPEPLDPGPQHLGDFSDAFRAMLRTVRIVNLDDGRRIVHEYQRAMTSPCSTILVEYPELYEKPL